MKFRLVSVWPGGSGPGIWFLAGLLMLEEALCCSAPPRTLLLPGTLPGKPLSLLAWPQQPPR